MSSAATAQSLTPAALEARLAALGIPVARLTAAAQIGSSTWRDWRASRTRPRPDLWAATTAAFNALVAEATPAPADVESEAPAAEPVVLTGSSAPTGVLPSFTPTATSVPAGAPADELVPTATAACNLATLADLLEEMDAWCRMSSDCSDMTVWPPVPEALFRRAEDGLWAADKVVQHQCGRRWYPPGAMDALRAMSFEGAFVDPSGRYRRRRDEVVAAFDRWTMAREAAGIVSGLNAAEAAATACGERIAAFRDAILDRPADNFGDVLAKAAVVSWWYVDVGEDAGAAFAVGRSQLLAKGDTSNPFTMALAILSDLARMAVAQGLTLERLGPEAGAGTREAPIAAAAA